MSEKFRGAEPPLSGSRRWGLRLLAGLAIPVGLGLLLETSLRLGDYGYSSHFFVRRLIGGQAAWIENQDFGRRFFPRGLERSAQPLSMSDVKKPGTLRVFVLGESAAMGDPDFKFGLPRMLAVILRARFPERRVEVVNAAVVAINSHVILPIAQDCAKRQGDLWVIYMGNNEMVGPFGAASIFGAQAPPLALVRAGLWLRTTRAGQLLDATLNRARHGSRAVAEWGGMEMMANQRVAHNAPAAARVYRNFERNLKDILATGAQAGVPVVLCTVATNHKDCAPFASLHRKGLTGGELKQWQRAYDEGIARQNQGDLTNALAAYREAEEIDGEFADLAFHQGECCLLLGRDTEAARFFQLACDRDALPFRADVQINEIIRRTAGSFADRHVSLVDAEHIFTEKSPNGLTGAGYFYEHVHLTPEGNYLLARSVAEQATRELPSERVGRWVTDAECFQMLGLTDWNRYDALEAILDRIQAAPFTNQTDHAHQVQYLNEQLARYRLATKPVQLRREAAQVAQLVSVHPDDPDLRWNLAALLQNLGDSVGAEQQWQALIALQPQSRLPRENLAKLLEVRARQNDK